MEPLTSTVLLLRRGSRSTRYRRGRYTSEKTIFSPSETKKMTFWLQRSLHGRFTVCKYMRILADSRCQIIARGPELTATRKTHTRNRYRTRPSIRARPVANRRERSVRYAMLARAPSGYGAVHAVVAKMPGDSSCNPCAGFRGEDPKSILKFRDCIGVTQATTKRLHDKTNH